MTKKRRGAPPTPSAAPVGTIQLGLEDNRHEGITSADNLEGRDLDLDRFLRDQKRYEEEKRMKKEKNL